MIGRKNYFSLLELLIVVFLLSFGIALTGVKIKEIYQEQRFYSDAQQVLSHLMMAQDLMLIMDTDVEVKLAKNPETHQLQIWLEVEKPIEEMWSKRFIERKVPLSAIHSWDLKEKNSLKSHKTILFSLGQMSKGILTLYEGEKHDEREFQIELTGYPVPLKAHHGDTRESRNAEHHRLEKSKKLYPAEVYEELYEDPNQKTETA